MYKLSAFLLLVLAVVAIDNACGFCYIHTYIHRCHTPKLTEKIETLEQKVDQLIAMVANCTVNEKSVQVHCPQGWQTYQGSVSCYKMINKVSNWIDARKACVSIGGDLVTITSARENAYVARLGQTYSNKGTLLWIGLHRDSTKKFKWVDGSALSGQYSKWNANEPNSVAEECGMMYLTKQHGSLWNDSHCHSKYLIMCEKDRK